jgi:hypothetical protein
MKIQTYRNLEIIADQVAEEEGGRLAFSVQVYRSPAGESGSIRQSTPPGLWRRLRAVEQRKLDQGEIIALGESLTDLLLPGEAQSLFERSLDHLERDEGLRVHLRLDPALAGFPWEYLYLSRGAGEKDVTGFLALDPRISFVRYEALPLAADLVARPRRALVALASPDSPEYPHLDLVQERRNLEAALADVNGIAVNFVDQASLQNLTDALMGGADIFHFAGHGDFIQQGLGQRLGAITGEGALVLESGDGGVDLVPAEQLAVNLRGRGVQLAVLGACRTGRRDGENVWSGVAPALMRAGIPAVVAMQYKIWDEAAIAFSRSFYKGLASGLILDQAVAVGRIAAFNQTHARKDDYELGRYWQDWGAPVLYSRLQGDFQLTAISDPAEREAQLTEVLAEMTAQIQELMEEIRAMSKEPSRTINTGGGAYIEGGVDTGGGDFVGRDKVVKGDEVKGDKVGGDQITIGDVGSGAAVAAGRGARAEVSHGPSGAEIARLFDPIYRRIETHPNLTPLDRADLKEEVEEVHAEVEKGDQADESFLARRLRNLRRVAPDILDVVLATLTHPGAGFATAVRKVAERMKES